MEQKGQALSIEQTTWKDLKKDTAQTYAMHQSVLPIAVQLMGFRDYLPRETFYVIPLAVELDRSRNHLHDVVLDQRDGLRVQTLDLDSKRRIRDRLFQKRNSAPGQELPVAAITNLGNRIAIAESSQLTVFDPEESEAIWKASFTNIDNLIFGSDHHWLAVADKHGVNILDCESGTSIQVFEEPGALIAYAAAADRLVVASPDQGGRVRIFDTKSWRTTCEHQTDTARRTAISISGDGRRVAMALANCKLELWDIDRLQH